MGWRPPSSTGAQTGRRSNVIGDMSISGKSEPGAQGKRQKRTRREIARFIVVAVLVVLVILFAVSNLEEVKVHWIYISSSRAPLIVVIIVSLLVGGAITYLGERKVRKR